MEDQHSTSADELEGPRLISVDELRAAGALDVPAAWRKSLAGGQKSLAVERNLFSGLADDEPEEQEPMSLDAGLGGSAQDGA